MAKLYGGITGRPSGKIGNVIFGAARTRRGKSATARATFSPSNPNTPAQQAQRNRMRSLSRTAARWDPTYGRAQWNVIEGNLPVYQSILRLLFQASDAEGNLSIPRPVSLGPTPGLQNLQISSGGGTGVLLLTGRRIRETARFLRTLCSFLHDDRDQRANAGAKRLHRNWSHPRRRRGDSKHAGAR